MIIGQDNPDYSILKMDSGQYFQVYEDTRDYMTPKSVGNISLIPKNYRGSYYLMSLKNEEESIQDNGLS